MSGLEQGLIDAVVGVLVLVWVIRRQMVERRLTTTRMLTIPVLLVLIGLVEDRTVLDRLDSPTPLALLVGGVLLGAVAGAARAASQRLIWRDGVVYTRGTRWTMVLWLATLLVRGGMAALAAMLHSPEGTGEILLFLGVTLGVQNLLLARRAGLPILGAPPVQPAPEDRAAAGSPPFPEN
jgi:hypothetical protein